MKSNLYWLLSVQSFFQFPNGKVFGVSNFFVVMSLCAFIAAIPIGMGLDYGESFPYVIPFILFGILMVTSKWTLGVVPKSIQDKYWKTQLVRFKDPAFKFQMSLYPNFEQRMIVLLNMWRGEFGLSFEETKAPWFQVLRIFILLILSFAGLCLGFLLG